MSDDPQSTRAWAKGSEGERRLAKYLLAAVGERAVLLHDRKVPKTSGNIDHLAIAASGIWVIDAKKYKGQVEQRDVGTWFTTDHRLYVNNRDQTKLAEKLGWQIDAVRSAVGDTGVPINAALCFVSSEWKLFAKPFTQNGVWITWPKKLAHLVAEPGPLTPPEVVEIANQLATKLPAAVLIRNHDDIAEGGRRYVSRRVPWRSWRPSPGGPAPSGGTRSRRRECGPRSIARPPARSRCGRRARHTDRRTRRRWA